ncbi:GIN domain-containing protein [Vaginella massiliensis]|uniref:GIN domain-containing protein n=1 Tax=Vaginella massiliensis TaxID=1816680 RepID=UPI003751CFC4
MIKKLLLSTVALVSFTACSSSIDGEGPGDIKHQVAVEHIKSIEVDCNCQVTILQGNENRVEVESHQNIIDNLKINSKGNIVLISETQEVDTYNNYRVYLYVTKELEDLEISGLTDVMVSGTLNVDKLDLKIKDQARIEEAYIIANEVEIKAQNQSQINLQGAVNKLLVKAYDQSNLDLGNFVAYDTEFLAEDNVNFIVNAKSALIGKASGTALIQYIGDPRKDTKVSDQAQVIKK